MAVSPVVPSADGALRVFEAEHGSSKIDINRFKGLGEMDWEELKPTTMDAATRTLLQRYFPGDYRVIAPGADPGPKRSRAAVLRLVMIAGEERAALADMRGRWPSAACEATLMRCVAVGEDCPLRRFGSAPETLK